MPILHVQVQGQGQTPDGKTVTVHPAIALQQRGPVVQVVVSVEQSMAQALLQQGQAVPPPKTGFALIDTGASFTCIDDQAAKDLGLPIIDVASISSASHAQHQCNVYPVQISIPPMLILQSPRTIGAALAAQGLLVLIGRDVLQHCLLVYNGGTGSITLSL